MKNFHRLLPFVTIGIASGVAVNCKSSGARFNDVSISVPDWKNPDRGLGKISISLFWIGRDPDTQKEAVYRGRCTDSAPSLVNSVTIPSKRWSRENCKDSVDAVSLEDFKKSFQEVAQRLVYTDSEKEQALHVKQFLEKRKGLSLELESLERLLQESKAPATSMFPTMIADTKLKIARVDSSMKALNGGFDDLQSKLASAIQALEFVEREMRGNAPVYELNPDSESDSPMLNLVADIVGRAFAEAANFRASGGKVGQASKTEFSNMDADFESIARENTLRLRFEQRQLEIRPGRDTGQVSSWYFIDISAASAALKMVPFLPSYLFSGTEVFSGGNDTNEGWLQQEMLDALEREQLPGCQLSVQEQKSALPRNKPPVLDGTYVWQGGLDLTWPTMRFERDGIVGDGSASEDELFLECGFVTSVSIQEQPRALRSPKRIFKRLTISKERTPARPDLTTDIRLDWRTARRLFKIIDTDFAKNNGMAE